MRGRKEAWAGAGDQRREGAETAREQEVVKEKGDKKRVERHVEETRRSRQCESQKERGRGEGGGGGEGAAAEQAPVRG